MGDHVQAVVRNPPLNTVAIPPKAFRYDAFLVGRSAQTIYAVKYDGDSWGCAVAACRVEGLSAVGLKILPLWREVCNGTTPPTYLQAFQQVKFTVGWTHMCIQLDGGTIVVVVVRGDPDSKC